MESEIETFKNRKEPQKNKNIEQLKEQFSNFNRRSDDFLEQLEKMKGQFSIFSEDLGVLRKIKEEKNRDFSTYTTNNSQEINTKIQFFIENILYFQKEITDNNRILSEYALYFDGVERKLEEYEKSLEKNKIIPENVDFNIYLINIYYKIS